MALDLPIEFTEDDANMRQDVNNNLKKFAVVATTDLPVSPVLNGVTIAFAGVGTGDQPILYSK